MCIAKFLVISGYAILPEFIASIHEHIFDPARLPIAIAALVLSVLLGAVLGPVGGSANPVLWRFLDGLLGGLGRRLDRADRDEADLIFRGFILTAIGMAVAFFIGKYAMYLSELYPEWNLVDMIALLFVTSSASVWSAQGKLYKALSSNNLVKGAFYAIVRTTRINLAEADEYTITRTGMAMGARAFDKMIVGPLLWYLILGLPAAFLYAGLAALSWRFGRDGFTKGFGRLALELEKLMGFVPNLIAGLLIALAGVFTPTGRMSGALTGFFAQKGKAPYFEGGWPVTATAFALNVSLGGAAQDLDGRALKRTWAGPEKATAQLSAQHLRRAGYIVFMAHILWLAALLGAMLISGHHLLDF